RVNGQRVRRAMLLPDDQLHIASYKFLIQFGPEPAPPPQDEHTQHLDADEVANLLRQAKQRPLDDSDEDISIRPLQANPLPDIYPPDESKKYATALRPTAYSAPSPRLDLSLSPHYNPNVGPKRSSGTVTFVSAHHGKARSELLPAVTVSKRPKPGPFPSAYSGLTGSFGATCGS